MVEIPIKFIIITSNISNKMILTLKLLFDDRTENRNACAVPAKKYQQQQNEQERI